MLILAKFLAGKITKIFDFSKAKVLYFDCLMDKKRVGHGKKRVSLNLMSQKQTWRVHFSISWTHSSHFFFFTENFTISVFTVSSEEKPGSVVLPVGEWSKPLTSFICNAHTWLRPTAGSRSNHFTHSSPAFPPTPASLQGLMATSRWRKLARWAQQPGCTSLQSDGRRWSTGHGLDALSCVCALTSISLPTVNVCLAHGWNHSAHFIWFLLFSSPVPR